MYQIICETSKLFKLIAAVCENGALAEISQTDYTLSGRESRRVVRVSADLNNVKDLSSAKIKVFAFLDYKTLIPLSSVVMNGEIDKAFWRQNPKNTKKSGNNNSRRVSKYLQSRGRIF
ncbi:MAG: hypothetical protein L6V93_13280 [Clostridiales bacterium]|nr:MAG: hypothetical protein L6V93_13280 [Clostridiales bacterium]